MLTPILGETEPLPSSGPDASGRWSPRSLCNHFTQNYVLGDGTYSEMVDTARRAAGSLDPTVLRYMGVTPQPFDREVHRLPDIASLYMDQDAIDAHRATVDHDIAIGLLRPSPTLPTPAQTPPHLPPPLPTVLPDTLPSGPSYTGLTSAVGPENIGIVPLPDAGITQSIMEPSSSLAPPHQADYYASCGPTPSYTLSGALGTDLEHTEATIAANTKRAPQDKVELPGGNDSGEELDDAKGNTRQQWSIHTWLGFATACVDLQVPCFADKRGTMNSIFEELREHLKERGQRAGNFTHQTLRNRYKALMYYKVSFESLCSMPC